MALAAGRAIRGRWLLHSESTLRGRAGTGDGHPALRAGGGSPRPSGTPPESGKHPQQHPFPLQTRNLATGSSCEPPGCVYWVHHLDFGKEEVLMRILHTSDWHLGRALCGERLLDDQAFVLDQLTRIADDYHPDAVLVAGDVYDRAVPAPDAVQLLDDVVTRLVLDGGIHVFLIAGNHDSGTRLSFGARLLARGKLHLIGSLREGPSVVVLPDDYGDVSICTVPYAEPMLAADELDCPSICDHDTAMRAAVERVRAAAPAGRTVLMTHAFVAGGEISESERKSTRLN